MNEIIFLIYKDALGTFAKALLVLNEDNEVLNVDTLPDELQYNIKNGFCDIDIEQARALN